MAGGSGSRFGGAKQFLQLNDRPVAAWAVESARSVAGGVVLVVPAGMGSDPQQWGADVVVHGGSSRSASVRAGLAAVPDDASVIVVHDAARPLAPASLFSEVVSALSPGEVDGVIPVLAVADTLKRVAGNEVLDTVDRQDVVAVQTPQAFTAGILRSAHASGGDATDDAGLLEASGATVRTVPGDPRNIKLTYPEDVAVAVALVGQISSQPSGSTAALRIGQGVDIHRFSADPDRPLVLGGVTFTGQGAAGLDGHSDADVVAHAIADAVLGASGLGDLGRHAPDTDPAWAGADSIEMLVRMVGLAAAAGWIPMNADCTVIAELPRLAPSVGAMAERLTSALGAPVNVKATRAEGLGALGRAEGIGCTAVVLMAAMPVAASGSAPAGGLR